MKKVGNWNQVVDGNCICLLSYWCVEQISKDGMGHDGGHVELVVGNGMKGQSPGRVTCFRYGKWKALLRLFTITSWLFSKCGPHLNGIFDIRPVSVYSTNRFNELINLNGHDCVRIWLSYNLFGFAYFHFLFHLQMKFYDVRSMMWIDLKVLINLLIFLLFIFSSPALAFNLTTKLLSVKHNSMLIISVFVRIFNLGVKR